MEKERLKIFSERLSNLRKKKELTQQQLSEILQIPRVSITKYETAERTPTVDHLVQFAQFFNVPSDYLLGLSSVESYDIELQAICDYIGLSENAVAVLHEISLGQANYAPIQSWIIFDGYLAQFALLLYDLEKETQEFLKYEKETRQTLLEEAQKRKTRIISEKFLFDQAKSIVDDALRCDTFRYQLIKLTEKMANHFDQREQVQDNGKHNPPKK